LKEFKHSTVMLSFRIWGSHGVEYDDGCLLDYSAV
jgi:hypothetical protein